MSDTLSQSTRIYRLIKKQNGKGTANHELARISLKYSSRIDNLRKDGHNISAERVYRNGRATGTWLYFLNDEEIVEEHKPLLRRILHV